VKRRAQENLDVRRDFADEGMQSNLHPGKSGRIEDPHLGLLCHSQLRTTGITSEANRYMLVMMSRCGTKPPGLNQ
jgi:hypothetical protein